MAWGYTALPFELVLLLLALPLVRPSIILGADACTPGLVPTPVADPCSSQPMQFWLPLLLFAAASVMTLAAVRAGKHRARVTGSAEQSKPG